MPTFLIYILSVIALVVLGWGFSRLHQIYLQRKIRLGVSPRREE